MQYCAQMASTLSTTAYAVLGMLTIRPLTAYELTQQMQRSLDYCWPTSERSLYDQPERLVAAGLAVAEIDGDGRRRYAATDRGRVVLQSWLATEPGAPRFQNEPLLRFLFADQGSIEDLQRALAVVRRHATERRRLGLDQMRPYLSGDGLFQERAHIVTLMADLVGRLLATLEDWADDVDALAAAWPTTQVGLTPEIRAILEAVLTREAARTDFNGH
jgi:PadR family transcriptional regulator AphA